MLTCLPFIAARRAQWHSTAVSSQLPASPLIFERMNQFSPKNCLLSPKKFGGSSLSEKNPYLARKKKGGSSLAKKIAYLAKNLFEGSSLAKKTPYLAKKIGGSHLAKKLLT